LIHGSLRSQILRNSLLRTIRLVLGFHLSFRKRDSTTGLLMPRTGASQEIDIGVIPFLSGHLKMERKSSASALLKN
jgi:hypothetical protein